MRREAKDGVSGTEAERSEARDAPSKRPQKRDMPRPNQSIQKQHHTPLLGVRSLVIADDERIT